MKDSRRSLLVLQHKAGDMVHIMWVVLTALLYIIPATTAELVGHSALAHQSYREYDFRAPCIILVAEIRTSGFLTHFEARVAGVTPVHYQIWRPVPGPEGLHQLVYDEFIAAYSIVHLSVRVYPGDRVGFTTTSGKSGVAGSFDAQTFSQIERLTSSEAPKVGETYVIDTLNFPYRFLLQADIQTGD